ncbi:unnamed protein product [Bathycoccus prasinos]
MTRQRIICGAKREAQGPLLSCKQHSIDHRETTNAEGVCCCQGDCLLGASVKFQSGKKERL